jgi:hypothetical protein
LYVPAVDGAVALCVPELFVVEFVIAPPVNVTLWGLEPLQVQVTVAPAETAIAAGPKLLSWTVTDVVATGVTPPPPPPPPPPLGAVGSSLPQAVKTIQRNATANGAHCLTLECLIRILRDWVAILKECLVNISSLMQSYGTRSRRANPPLQR